MSRPLSLAIVGHVDIPAQALKHRFTLEALACAALLERNHDPQRQVIGTGNTQQCELYGWLSNVDGHRDNTGWMYLLPLNEGRTTICAYASCRPRARKLHTVEVVAGDVVRLWDFCEHWTEDSACRVAAFVGSWKRPADAEAVAILQAGVERLASGDYYGAPRVRPGFRVLMDDECLVANDDFTELAPMLVADARQQERYIEVCHCGKPAVRPDDKWPYFTEFSRCRDHLAGRD